MGRGPLETYQDRVLHGEIDADPAQAEAAERLNRLAAEIAQWRPKSGGLLGVFRRETPPPRGLYIHGAVGRGKTMLMDLFHSCLGATPPARRIHFHEFMAETHDLIGRARRTAKGDPIPEVAAAIAARARVLCFDELHVTDIADAMILGRLFRGLFEAGTVIVATSNAHPRELYKNGLNRQLFLPFVDLIEQHMEVMELASARDFRLAKLAGHPLYFTPADDRARGKLRKLFTSLSGQSRGEPAEIDVKGRKVAVPEAARGVAWFRFDDLCDRPLGALDYLHVAHAFHTVVIEGIPVLTPDRRNAARRFVNLIDTLYDNRVSLVVSADAEPHGLYVKGDGTDLFERTASRLIEMRSEEYLARRAERGVVMEA